MPGNTRTIVTPFASLGLPPRTVVLTFDDGPTDRANITARLLDVLECRGVKAVFCVVGKYVERYPWLIRRIVADGHLIAGHSYDHPFAMLNAAAAEASIDRTDRAIVAALDKPGYQTMHFRPAGGLINPEVSAVLHRRNLRLLPVTFLPLDIFYSPLTASAFVHDIMRPIRRDNGAMLVIHEYLSGYPQWPWLIRQRWCNGNRTWVPDAVDKLIETLQAEEYDIGLAGCAH